MSVNDKLRALKARARAPFNRMTIAGLYDLAKKGYLHERGWFRSLNEGKPVDLSGSPLPWITYPAIDLLRDRLPEGLCVFEFGAGASTMWWHPRVRRLVSCEHHEGWFEHVRSSLPAGVDLRFRDATEVDTYADTVLESGERYDVIVIDGRNRVACSERVLDALSERGVVIWDNSERERYRTGIEALHASGLASVPLWGMTPGSFATSCTSIFYQPGRNVLGL